MELPILKHLPMPDVAVRLVTQFLRKPHPTAAMIKALTFSRCSKGFSVQGKTLRFHKMNTYPPKYCCSNVVTVLRMRAFYFDVEDGEFNIESDYGQGMTIDDMRELGMSDDELSAMGYDIMEVEALSAMEDEIVEVVERNVLRRLGFSNDELSAMGYDITN